MDLRELRARRGLTITELEERSGCSKHFIRRLECGLANIDNCLMGNVVKAAAVLGVSLEEFYNAAKNTEPNHKVGNPLMKKGQPAVVRGDSWKYRRNDGVERPAKSGRKRGRPALKDKQNTFENEANND